MNFERLTPYIRRLKVPFDNIYTGVFLVDTPNTCYLIDCATTAQDVDERILPALEKEGVALSGLTLLLTHWHEDHAGGLTALASAVPELTVGFFACGSAEEQALPLHIRRLQLTDGTLLDGVLSVMHLPGHTDDAVGYLDVRTGTLLSGDCVQQYGVSHYGCGLYYPNAYVRTLRKLSEDVRVKELVCSHDFAPLGGILRGRENVEHGLRLCLEYDALVHRFLAQRTANGTVPDPRELSDAFTSLHPQLLPGELNLPAHTVARYLDGNF